MIGKWMKIVCENNYTPPQYDEDDAEHYDALGKTGFFGAQAAGCIPFCRLTGRFMLVLRSRQVEESGTWGNVGGAHKVEERPMDAALRELHEETGYAGHAQMVPLLVYTSGTFRYSNFLALVDQEFVPDLGWEADNYKWCTLEDLPSPLHFGIEALLSDPKSREIIRKYQEALK